MSSFRLEAPYQPAGDQPQAIEKLIFKGRPEILGERIEEIWSKKLPAGKVKRIEFWGGKNEFHKGFLHNLGCISFITKHAAGLAS